MTPHSARPTAHHAFFAKLVVCFGAVLAMATENIPPALWTAADQQLVSVVLDESSGRKLLLTIELGGELYARAYSGSTDLRLTTDRAASDLTFEVRRLGASSADSTSAGDAGAEPYEGGSEWSAEFGLDSPDRAFHRFELACPSREPEQREQTCS